MIGIGVVLVRKSADQLGVKLEVRDMSFTAFLSFGSDRKFDIAIAGIHSLDERKKAVDFSKFYWNALWILLICDADKYKPFEDFRCRTSGARKSTLQKKLAHE